MKLTTLIQQTNLTRWKGTATEEQAVRLATVCADILRDPDPAKITKDDLRLLQRALLARGLAPGTVNSHLSRLSAVLSSLPDPPRVSRLREPPGRSATLTEPQVLALVSRLPDPESRLVRFLWETGCRSGEALALTWDRVDFQRRRATFTLTKNGETRTIPLTPTAIEVLGPASEGRVFRTTQSRLNHRFRAARDALGLPPEIVVHSLRHSYGTRLAAEGVSLPIIAKVLGHRDFASTARYSHASLVDVEKALGL